MVDQPVFPVAHEQVHVAGCAVDVRDQRVEPDDIGCEVGINVAIDDGVEWQGARDKGQPEVLAVALTEDVLDFRVRFATSKSLVEGDDGRFCDGEVKFERQSSRQRFGDECPMSLAGATGI